MDFKKYLDTFQKAADQLDRKRLSRTQVEVAVGIGLDSVFLKLYKKAWANDPDDPLVSESRIFFSVWINDSTIKKQQLSYNIHALKLRKLKGYSIESRKFADTFRKKFRKFEPEWPNVSVKFGPLTLMEGWIELNPGNIQDTILGLASHFLEIEHLIDETLAGFRVNRKL